MAWTKARDTRLMEMVRDGYSASDIGDRLGVTRNAVLGRKHRIKGTVFPYRTKLKIARKKAADARHLAKTAAIKCGLYELEKPRTLLAQQCGPSGITSGSHSSACGRFVRSGVSRGVGDVANS